MASDVEDGEIIEVESSCSPLSTLAVSPAPLPSVGGSPVRNSDCDSSSSEDSVIILPTPLKPRPPVVLLSDEEAETQGVRSPSAPSNVDPDLEELQLRRQVLEGLLTRQNAEVQDHAGETDTDYDGQMSLSSSTGFSLYTPCSPVAYTPQSMSMSPTSPYNHEGDSLEFWDKASVSPQPYSPDADVNNCDEREPRTIPLERQTIQSTDSPQNQRVKDSYDLTLAQPPLPVPSSYSSNSFFLPFSHPPPPMMPDTTTPSMINNSTMAFGSDSNRGVPQSNDSGPQAVNPFSTMKQFYRRHELPPNYFQNTFTERSPSPKRANHHIPGGITTFSPQPFPTLTLDIDQRIGYPQLMPPRMSDLPILGQSLSTNLAMPNMGSSSNDRHCNTTRHHTGTNSSVASTFMLPFQDTDMRQVETRMLPLPIIRQNNSDPAANIPTRWLCTTSQIIPASTYSSSDRRLPAPVIKSATLVLRDKNHTTSSSFSATVNSSNSTVNSNSGIQDLHSNFMSPTAASSVVKNTFSFGSSSSFVSPSFNPMPLTFSHIPFSGCNSGNKLSTTLIPTSILKNKSTAKSIEIETSPSSTIPTIPSHLQVTKDTDSDLQVSSDRNVTRTPSPTLPVIRFNPESLMEVSSEKTMPIRIESQRKPCDLREVIRKRRQSSFDIEQPIVRRIINNYAPSTCTSTNVDPNYHMSTNNTEQNIDLVERNRPLSLEREDRSLSSDSRQSQRRRKVQQSGSRATKNGQSRGENSQRLQRSKSREEGNRKVQTQETRNLQKRHVRDDRERSSAAVQSREPRPKSSASGHSRENRPRHKSADKRHKLQSRSRSAERSRKSRSRSGGRSRRGRSPSPRQAYKPHNRKSHTKDSSFATSQTSKSIGIESNSKEQSRTLEQTSKSNAGVNSKERFRSTTRGSRAAPSNSKKSCRSPGQISKPVTVRAHSKERSLSHFIVNSRKSQSTKSNSQERARSQGRTTKSRSTSSHSNEARTSKPLTTSSKIPDSFQPTSTDPPEDEERRPRSHSDISTSSVEILDEVHAKDSGENSANNVSSVIEDDEDALRAKLLMEISKKRLNSTVKGNGRDSETNETVSVERCINQTVSMIPLPRSPSPSPIMNENVENWLDPAKSTPKASKKQSSPTPSSSTSPSTQANPNMISLRHITQRSSSSRITTSPSNSKTRSDISPVRAPKSPVVSTTTVRAPVVKFVLGNNTSQILNDLPSIAPARTVRFSRPNIGLPTNTANFRSQPRHFQPYPAPHNSRFSKTNVPSFTNATAKHPTPIIINIRNHSSSEEEDDDRPERTVTLLNQRPSQSIKEVSEKGSESDIIQTDSENILASVPTNNNDKVSENSKQLHVNDVGNNSLKESSNTMHINTENSETANNQQVDLSDSFREQLSNFITSVRDEVEEKLKDAVAVETATLTKGAKKKLKKRFPNIPAVVNERKRIWKIKKQIIKATILKNKLKREKMLQALNVSENKSCVENNLETEHDEQNKRQVVEESKSVETSFQDNDCGELIIAQDLYQEDDRTELSSQDSSSGRLVIDEGLYQDDDRTELSSSQDSDSGELVNHAGVNQDDGRTELKSTQEEDRGIVVIDVNLSSNDDSDKLMLDTKPPQHAENREPNSSQPSDIGSKWNIVDSSAEGCSNTTLLFVDNLPEENNGKAIVSEDKCPPQYAKIREPDSSQQSDIGSEWNIVDSSSEGYDNITLVFVDKLPVSQDELANEDSKLSSEENDAERSEPESNLNEEFELEETSLLPRIAPEKEKEEWALREKLVRNVLIRKMATTQATLGLQHTEAQLLNARRNGLAICDELRDDLKKLAQEKQAKDELTEVLANLRSEVIRTERKLAASKENVSHLILKATQKQEIVKNVESEVLHLTKNCSEIGEKVHPGTYQPPVLHQKELQIKLQRLRILTNNYRRFIKQPVPSTSNLANNSDGKAREVKTWRGLTRWSDSEDEIEEELNNRQRCLFLQPDYVDSLNIPEPKTRRTFETYEKIVPQCNITTQEDVAAGGNSEADLVTNFDPLAQFCPNESEGQECFLPTCAFQHLYTKK